jgi:hypothetical protein
MTARKAAPPEPWLDMAPDESVTSKGRIYGADAMDADAAVFV